MKAGYIFISFLFVLCSSQTIRAQKERIYQIDEVKIHSNFSSQYQVGYTITHINDSMLKSSTSLLPQLLKKQANIYIKEQGNGMVASISLRGGGASHTGVFWNGIPINSSLNGQTDFNTIFPSQYNSISIRKGGGSVLLGSGAIGGAINLENQFIFDAQTTGSISLNLASYESYMGSVDLGHSTEKISVKANLSAYTSRNNYPYLGTDQYNKNGEILHTDMQFATALKINSYHQVYLKSLHKNSDRNTSGSIYADSNANLTYQTNRVLAGWKFDKNNFKNELKSVFIKEKYHYIYDKNVSEFYSENSSIKYFSNYTTNYKLNNKIRLLSGVSYEYVRGEGTDLNNVIRRNTALYTWLNHQLSKSFLYNISVRKEWSDWYKIPLVFSVDSRMKWNEIFTSKFNFSTNYRTPTINDLFWKVGGNSNLLPENSWTTEIAQEIQHKNIQLAITVFGGRSTNLIQWKPVDGAIWKPINIQNVYTYGSEFHFKISKSFNDHQLLSNTYYSYTHSIDNATQEQLVYTPYHLAQSNLDYQFKEWQVSYDISYTGKSYTTSTNTQYVDAYFLSNLSLTKNFKNNKYVATAAINNLFNTEYQVVSSRPMPNRNYKLTLLFKF